MSRSKKTKPLLKKTRKCIYERNHYHQQKKENRNKLVEDMAKKISALTMNIHTEPNIIIDLDFLPKQCKIGPDQFRTIKRDCFPKPSSKDGKGIQGNGLATNNHRLMFESKPEQGKTYCMNHKLIYPNYCVHYSTYIYI
jgi:hypothetical protein